MRFLELSNCGCLPGKAGGSPGATSAFVGLNFDAEASADDIRYIAIREEMGHRLRIA
jgi:hypothetical protein